MPGCEDALQDGLAEVDLLPVLKISAGWRDLLTHGDAVHLGDHAYGIQDR